MILPDFLLLGPVSLKRIRIRLAKMKRIQADPDPKHCLLGRAVAMGLPILCLYRPQEGKLLSGMIRGKFSNTKNSTLLGPKID